MKPSLIILCGLALIAYSPIAAMVQSASKVVTPQPVDPVADLDLVAVFSKADDHAIAATHAREFAKLCEQNAYSIKFDGEQSEQQFTNDRLVHDATRLTRYFQIDGRSYSTAYPSLKDALREFMDKRLGSEPGKVDDAKRKQWEACFLELRDEANYAADRMEWEG